MRFVVMQLNLASINNSVAHEGAVGVRKPPIHSTSLMLQPREIWSGGKAETNVWIGLRQLLGVFCSTGGYTAR